MFLLRTGESVDIKIDSFSKGLKPLLSQHEDTEVVEVAVMVMQ